MRRRRFLSLAGIAAAGIGAEALGFGPRRLAVTHHSLPGFLPRGTPPLRFVQVSDLHLRGVGAVHERLIAAVHRAAPAFVVFTGDSVDRADALPLLERFLTRLGLAVPAYACLGNWEHWGGVDLAALRRVYAASGCRLLVNESVVHPHGDAGVRITGLDDLVGGRPDPALALRDAEPLTAHLMLCHCPAQRDRLADALDARSVAGMALRPGLDPRHLAGALVLSGHTHGGQVKLGGWAPLRPPGSGRYVAGWYRGGGAPAMYVSRGVGTSVVPARLGASPEVAVFTAEAA